MTPPESTPTPPAAPPAGSSPAKPKRPMTPAQVAGLAKGRELRAANIAAKRQGKPAPLPAIKPTPSPGPSAPAASVAAPPPAPSAETPKKGRFLFFDIDPPKVPVAGGVAAPGNAGKPKGFFDRLGF